MFHECVGSYRERFSNPSFSYSLEKLFPARRIGGYSKVVNNLRRILEYIMSEFITISSADNVKANEYYCAVCSNKTQSVGEMFRPLIRIFVFFAVVGVVWRSVVLKNVLVRS